MSVLPFILFDIVCLVTICKLKKTTSGDEVEYDYFYMIFLYIYNGVRKVWVNGIGTIGWFAYHTPRGIRGDRGNRGKG